MVQLPPKVLRDTLQFSSLENDLTVCHIFKEGSLLVEPPAEEQKKPQEVSKYLPRAAKFYSYETF